MSRVNNLSLALNDEALYNDLTIALVERVYSILQRMEDEMRAWGSPKISATWIKYAILNKATNTIEGCVGNDHWYAFIDNYGSGSAMAGEDINPWLSKYIKNKTIFNQARRKHGNSVLGRPKGTYQVPNWEEGDGYITREVKTGKYTGENLEDNYNATPRKFPSFEVTFGKFWLENTMQRYEKEMADGLQEVLETFPYYRYLKGGGK